MMGIFTTHKSKNLLIILLFLLNVGLLVALWLPRTLGPPPLRKPGGRVQKINQFFKQELDLSKEQTTQFLASSEAHRERIREARQGLRANRKALMETMITQGPATPILDSLLNGILSQHQVYESSIVQNYQELWNICNPDQRQKLSEIFKETLRPPRPRHRPR